MCLEIIDAAIYLSEPLGVDRWKFSYCRLPNHGSYPIQAAELMLYVIEAALHMQSFLY
jgi:hypothetical protein